MKFFDNSLLNYFEFLDQIFEYHSLFFYLVPISCFFLFYLEINLIFYRFVNKKIKFKFPKLVFVIDNLIHLANFQKKFV